MDDLSLHYARIGARDATLPYQRNSIVEGKGVQGKKYELGDVRRRRAKAGSAVLCKIMDRATHCAIAQTPDPLCGAKKCTGRPTAPVMTRYRCFLPDLAGLAGLRRVGPGTRLILTLPS